MLLTLSRFLRPTPALPCLAGWPQVVHVGVGPVSQSDVQLAVPLGAKILGFNVRSAAADVDALAKQHDVEVSSSSVSGGPGGADSG